MFAKQTTVNVSTKLNDKATVKTVTRLTIDWDLTEDQMQLAAQKTLVIKAQALWRNAEAVPAQFRAKASELFSGVKTVVVEMSPAELVAHYKATSQKDKARELLEMLQADLEQDEAAA